MKKILLFILMGAFMFTICGCKQKDENLKPINTVGKKISSLEKVKIGGIDQWIYINTNNDTKPVLLFLHGGPGYAMINVLHKFNSELEDYFTVVNWDQRGAGLSYSEEISPESMTLEQFDKDIHQLTTYLKKRFNQEKIYLLCHSFGTIFGVNAVRNYPNDYYAYIGVGQVVDIGENEQHSYDFALKSANETKNQTAIYELTQIGRPDEDGEYSGGGESVYDITVKWLEYFGGDLHGKSSNDELENVIYRDPIYLEKNKSKLIQKGLKFSSENLFEDTDITCIDLRRQYRKLKVPVFILSGRYDYDTSYKLAEEYYNILKVPSKQLVWFDNSAHFPFYEEPDKFNDILINSVLPQTYKTK